MVRIAWNFFYPAVEMPRSYFLNLVIIFSPRAFSAVAILTTQTRVMEFTE